MNKVTKRVSIFLIVAILVSCSFSMAFAENKVITIDGFSEECNIDISNVVDEKAVEVTGDYIQTSQLYVANGPVIVKFGSGWATQGISYSTSFDFQLDGDTVQIPGDTIFEENITFDVKNEPASEEDFFYPAGNYATLTNSGTYMVVYQPEVLAAQFFFIKVIGEDAAAETDTDATADTAADTVLPAVPTSSKVMVDGKKVSFDAYNINDNNYFKLRDIAQVVNGTSKQFEIGWDAEKNAINMTANQAYTSVGGELTVSENATNKDATLTTSKIYLNGEEVQLTAYNIDGNNYFKLRDLGKSVNFGVAWDGENNTIVVDTSKEYTE